MNADHDIKILLIDDEKDLCEAVGKVMSKAGLQFKCALTGHDGIARAMDWTPDVVVLDMVLPDTDGLAVLGQLKQSEPDLPVVILTGHETVRTAVDAMKGGAFTYMTKPFDNSELEFTVRQAAKTWQLMKEVRYLRTRMHAWLAEQGVITASDSMKALGKSVEAVAATDASVLIVGESGTGKELIATAVHNGSKRSKKPFVPADLSACPETLVESEIFGYERGAFTGAVSGRAGKLEMANGGTIFLDEIGNLPVNVQAKLLRVLETRRLERIGGKRDMPIDLRIIAASNIDLKDAIRKEKFRGDLYHRLNEFPITIPPLRNRVEDIPLLVDYFIRRFNREMDKRIVGISSDAVRRFEMYPWPGNVRELKNIVKRCMVVAEKKITLDDLPPELKSHAEDTISIVANHGLKGAVDEAVAAVEKRLIIETLQRVGGNRGMAAKALDIDEKTLYNKIKKYEISQKD